MKERVAVTLPYRPLAFWAIVCLGASPLEAQRADLLSHAGITDLATLERMIMVPMRDGIRLSTAVIRPKTVSGPLPTVLIRTPYLKDGELERGGLAVRFIQIGRAHV